MPNQNDPLDIVLSRHNHPPPRALPVRRPPSKFGIDALRSEQRHTKMSGARSARALTNRRSRSSASIIPPPPRLSIPDEPPKVPRRPPSKGNKRETLADIAKRIPIQLMRLYFNYPLRSAAEAMHISVTTLKRLCRRHGVKRWPHRQISGINRALNDLEAQHQGAGDDIDRGAVADQLRQLHRRREVIIELAFESDEETSRKDVSDDVPPMAHRRVDRSLSSPDTISSTMTATPSPPARSESIDSAVSFESMPESPGSVTSLDDGQPTSVWWQHTPVGGGSLASLGDADGGKAKTKGKGGRPRQTASTSSASPRSRASRTQRSSAIFGNLTITGSMDATADQHHRKGTSGTSSDASATVIANANSNANSSGVSEGREFSKASSGSAPSFPPKRLTPGSRVVSAAKIPAYMEMSVATAAAAAAAGRAGGNIFDHHTNVNQQMDDLAALGDLLFGPDDMASATAELRGVGAPAGVFSPNASQWAPCGPFNSLEMFPHDQSLFGVPSSSPLSSNDFASGWGALVGDRTNMGMPANVGLL